MCWKVDNSHVDCNDTGILFKEVRVENTMSDTLTKKFSMVQETLFPQQALPWADPIKGGNLAAAQLTHFDCGGVAVSLSLSHKLSDGFTFLKMFNDWAKLARNSTLLTNPPSLIGSTILQPKDDPFTPNLYVVGTNHDLSVVRLRFGSESIKRLQQKVSVESDVKNPTRYEVVSALVNKCAAMAAKDDNNPSSMSFPFTIYMPMNIRKLVTPPVPNYFGNFLSYMLIKISGEDDLKLPNLVSKIRNEKVKHWEKFKGKNEDEILAEIAKEEKGFPKDSSIRQTTSLCGYTLYDIDFGWGKPARATLGAIHEENVFVLMDTPEKGGIDVFGAFDESVAFRFKNDKDLLEFSSVDLSY